MRRKIWVIFCIVLSVVLPPSLVFSAFVRFGTTQTGSQTISSVNLSASTFYQGISSGTVIGAISATMSPSSPAFTGSFSLVSSGGSCSGGDTTDFQIVSGNLETNGYPAVGSYTVCIKATQAGISNSPLTQAETITGQYIYTTSFPATENPISQGGVWVNGAATGIDWGNVQTTTGLAFGVNEPELYADPSAVINVTFPNNQYAQATVYVNTSLSTDGAHEVELRFRTTITAHSITGYEVDCSVMPGNPYLYLVRWNGPVQNFTFLGPGSGSYCHNGDVLSGSMVGSTLTAYVNGTQVLQQTDTTYTSGYPGLGFYDDVDTDWSYFGFSNWSATYGH